MARFIYWLQIECRQNGKKKKKIVLTLSHTQTTRAVRETQLKINIYDFQIILMINFDSRKNYLFKQFLPANDTYCEKYFCDSNAKN